jgi:adenylate kinase
MPPPFQFSRLFSSSSHPLHLALMGAPGVGKGTFASRLGPHFNIPFISTGDLVRAEIKGKTAIGSQIATINAKGGFVDDEIIFGLLQKRLKNPDTKKGFLLDGKTRS